MFGPMDIALIVVAIVLLFGVGKIPEVAHSFGKAAGEFKKGQAEAELELKDIEKSIKERKSPEDKSSKIRKMAISLGISVEGRSDEQLLDEIEKKMPKIS
jgi:sec-independent protein translocase protein TatA